MNKSREITIEHLFFGYPTTDVLYDVNLSLKERGFYLLIGPNGGGKTTLLKLLMGLLKPSKGSISLFGKSPFTMRQEIGYVPQTYIFDPKFPLTVQEFVLMGSLSKLSWLGRYPKEVTEKSIALLEKFHLADLKNRLIGSLSGGQRQRASFARALMDNPRILLLDEPTTGIDKEASSIFHNELKSLKGDKTILMVTHTIPEFLDLVDKVLCIRGTCEEVSKEAVCSHHMLGVYHSNIGRK